MLCWLKKSAVKYLGVSKDFNAIHRNVAVFNYVSIGSCFKGTFSRDYQYRIETFDSRKIKSGKRTISLLMYKKNSLSLLVFAWHSILMGGENANITPLCTRELSKQILYNKSSFYSSNRIVADPRLYVLIYNVDILNKQ